jgi:uncharacterized membrane protein
MNGKRKQIAGCILFFLAGPVGFLISYYLAEAGQHSTEDIPNFILSVAGLFIGCLSFALLVLGIILFLRGRSQLKEQKKIVKVNSRNVRENSKRTSKKPTGIRLMIIGVTGLILFIGSAMVSEIVASSRSFFLSMFCGSPLLVLFLIMTVVGRSMYLSGDKKRGTTKEV